MSTAVAPYTVINWCAGWNCDPCHYRPAASFVTSTEVYYSGSQIIGEHARFNFGKTFYPLAVPVFETVARYDNASGQPVLYPSIPSRQLLGGVNIGQNADSFTPTSYYITPSYLQLMLMGATVYTTDLSMIRNFFGYATPPSSNPIFCDGWQVEQDPHDIITLAPNQLSTPIYRADDLNKTPVSPANLATGVLYNSSISTIGNVSFTVNALPNGKPDTSVYLMEGFVYNGPRPPPNQDVIVDLYIRDYSGCWDAQFTGSIDTLWYRGPNPYY